MNLLEVKDLYKSFQGDFFSPKKSVLKGVSFSLKEGEAYGFLGANGSGKSTTFKCLLNFIKKDSGEIKFFGSDLNLKLKSQIGFLPEKPLFHEELKAEEQLKFYLSLIRPLDSSGEKAIKEGLKRLDLYKAKDQRIKSFSKGMIQKLGILQASLHKPRLLILDEPFSGLDPDSRIRVRELLRELVEKGSSLLFSSHIFQDVEALCDQILVLKKGSVAFDGDLFKFSQNKKSKPFIYYFLNGKKEKESLNSLEEAQVRLKELLSQGAKILSFEQGLEIKYKEFLEEKE